MKTLLPILISLFSFVLLDAQYYYLPFSKIGKNPGSLNQDNEYPQNAGLPSGWTTILTGPQASGNWSATFAIPFKFYLNGALVKNYKASTSGLVTFNTKLSARIDSNNFVIPTSRIPDSTICIWGLRAVKGSFIVIKTFGTTPNRQLWISFNAFNEHNLKAGAIYASVVLEETSNKIYIVDQRTQCLSNGLECSDKTNLTLGIQIDSTYAIMVNGSPDYQSDNLNNASPDDNSYFEFVPGTQAALDVSGIRHDFKKYYLRSDFPQNVKGTFRNTGSSTIHKITYNYSVNNGPVFSKEITGINVTSSNDIQFTHPEPLVINSKGSYLVKSWISQINDNVSGTPGDDTIRSQIFVNDTTVARKLLHETFNSSTSAACKLGNETLHSVLNNHPGLWTEISYPFNQMSGGDPYYTVESGARATYYNGIQTIPSTLIDGRINLNPTAYNSPIFIENQSIPAFYTIQPSGTIKGQKIDLSIVIQTLEPVNAATKLFIAIAEKTTKNNIKSNGETIFYHVLKKFIPDATGTLVGEIPAASNKTFNFSWTVPGAYRLPIDGRTANIINLATEHSIEDFSNLEIIAWLQDSNRTILQSNFADLTYLVSNDNPVANKKITVYPNPATDYLFIDLSSFNLQQNLKILISDIKGNLVYADKTNLNALFVNSSTWAPGVYYIHIVGNNQEGHHKFMLVK
ncbi:MAG: T9SS type A sorting domain-containing protein [Saprospiraceae bacterium]|nr:T9SS type A sorting domain-containing protein [Saprospiraceae bacterium]